MLLALVHLFPFKSLECASLSGHCRLGFIFFLASLERKSPPVGLRMFFLNFGYFKNRITKPGDPSLLHSRCLLHAHLRRVQELYVIPFTLRITQSNVRFLRFVYFWNRITTHTSTLDPSLREEEQLLSPHLCKPTEAP